MELFIFYTFEGYTVAPNGDELDSMQVLGIESGSSREEALSNLLKNCSWIKEKGFSVDEIKCMQVVEKKK